MPLILLNKPFRVLSQFSDAGGRATLADFVDVDGVYPAGRLDFDSEGLLLLTDDGRLQARLSQPRSKLVKAYFAQVEGLPTGEQVDRLLAGVELNDGPAHAVAARCIDEPSGLWPRDPPVRHRAAIPTGWIDIALTEGRNRQVRRMTAAVGLPTLRLIRHAVGPFTVSGLAPGETRRMPNRQAWAAL